MKEKLKQWFTHNLLIKIVALVIAILLWLAFSVGEDPIKTADYLIPVEVEHLDEFRSQNHYIELDGEEDLENLQTRVYIKARGSVLEELQSNNVQDVIRAYVDVYELEDSKTSRLMIHYEISNPIFRNKFQFSDIKNKSYFEATVDDSISKDIEVRYEIRGSAGKGYIFFADDPEVQLMPETVTLTGPASQIEDISYGLVTVRLDGETTSVNKKSNIVLYNTSDEVVSYSRDTIWVSINEASVFVPVYALKTVPLQASVTGSVPEGYEYGKDLSLSVSDIQIYGPESSINKISSISLPKIDLTSLTSNYQKTYDLNNLLNELYPKGDVKLYADNEASTDVRFTVGKQETKTITINTEDISIYGLRTGWSCSFTAPSLSLDLVGLRKNLNDFDENKLVMSIRLKEDNFTAGKQQVQLEISGLSNVSLQDDSFTVEVEMKKVS